MDGGCAVGPNNQLLPLLEALNFAAIKHRDQRRKDASKTPYINHPIGVAHSLAAEGGVSDLATLQVRTIQQWGTIVPRLNLRTYHPYIHRQRCCMIQWKIQGHSQRNWMFLEKR